MSLSPRRMLAVGLVEIALGTAIYVGVSVGAILWAGRSAMVDEMPPGESQVSKMSSSIQSAHQTGLIAFGIGGTVALIGIGTSLVGAVRWLSEDSQAKDRAIHPAGTPDALPQRQ